MVKPTVTMKKKELEESCKRIGVPLHWYNEINDILISNGFDNRHLREQHAVPEILEFIKEVTDLEFIIKFIPKDSHSTKERSYHKAKCGLCGREVKHYCEFTDPSSSRVLCKRCYAELKEIFKKRVSKKTKKVQK